MANELEPGAILRDKYRVERVIGRGGMGCVLSAWHVDLEKRVAIKVLLSELREHGELVERFLREARAASRLDGEHVARILDVDRLSDGTPFIVMEYLEGHDLSTIRRTKSPARIRDAVEYVIQACDAIGQAHARGIVHRDIKPANLFLAKTQEGKQKIKVLDFGISKMSTPLGGSDPNMTKTSVVMGSAEYMSPEQMLSARDVDGRTDIWALGVVLFEILTGTPPFVGETLPQVCALVLSKPPPRPRTLRPDLPEVLEQTILRCLEKDRENRFATAADLALALQGSLSSTNLGLGPASVVAPTSPAPMPMMVPVPNAQGTVALPTPVPYDDGAFPSMASSPPPVPQGGLGPFSPPPFSPPPISPRGPVTSAGTSISSPPPAWPPQPTPSRGIGHSQPPLPGASSQPSAGSLSQPGLSPSQASLSQPGVSGSPTTTPYSRDNAAQERRGRGGVVVGAILAFAVIGIAIGVGVKVATDKPAATSTVASTESSPARAAAQPSDPAQSPARSTEVPSNPPEHPQSAPAGAARRRQSRPRPRMARRSQRPRPAPPSLPLPIHRPHPVRWPRRSPRRALAQSP
ncbi:MAG: protein kinase [Polyangiaceae bacterium]